MNKTKGLEMLSRQRSSESSLDEFRLNYAIREIIGDVVINPYMIDKWNNNDASELDFKSEYLCEFIEAFNDIRNLKDRK